MVGGGGGAIAAGVVGCVWVRGRPGGRVAAPRSDIQSGLEKL